MLTINHYLANERRLQAKIDQLNNQIGSLIEVIAARDKKHMAEKIAARRAEQIENELLADEVRQNHMPFGRPPGYTISIDCETDSMPAVIEVDERTLRMREAVYEWDE